MSTPLSDHALRRLLADAEPLLNEAAATSPERIDKYRITGVLGRGGMGVVYDAVDEELGRPVALKVLAPAAAADAALRERFLREARTAAHLHHPHVAAVYDAGDGWIAMRRIDGEPLHKAPPAPIATRVRWLRDAALAVQHAHDMGIVHRDLKPQNLLLEGETVFVTDFGLAKEIAVESSLSLSGHVLGTPSYMAPEQARGQVHAVDARTDVWGLGATLYHLLAGRPPFTADDAVALLARIGTDDPPPLAASASGVPRDLETIVLACLEKEPARRYATARALAEDLDRWLRGEPVQARRPTLAYRARKFAGRHRALVGLSAASVLALAALGAAAWNERVGRDATARALELADQIDVVLRDDALFRRMGDVPSATARLDAGIAACDAFLARHEVGRAWWKLGQLERRRGRFDESRAALDRAVALEPELIEARFERGLLLAGELAHAPESAAASHATEPADLARREDAARADLEAAQRGKARLSVLDAQFLEAELLRLRGDRGGARRAFEELARLDPVGADAVNGLLKLDLAEGNDAQAWYHAKQLADLAQGLGPAYVAQHAGAGEVAAALRVARSGEVVLEGVEGPLADFTQALAAGPSDALAWGNHALVRARQAARLATDGSLDAALDEWDGAIADGTRALTLDPKLVAAWTNRAVAHAERERLLARAGRGDEAAKERAAAGADLDEAVRLDPRFALARMHRSAQRRRVAAAALQDPQTSSQAEAALVVAGDDARRALELRVDDPAAWIERARTEEQEAQLFAARDDRVAAGHARDLALADLDVAAGLDADDARARTLREQIVREFAALDR